MIVNNTAVDWLTLTTFARDSITKELLLSELETSGKQKRDSAIRGYTGQQCEGAFVGRGMQAGKEHLMARYSGDLADRMSRVLRTWPLECSRIDLQITAPLHLRIEDSYDSFYRFLGEVNKHEEAKWPKNRSVDGVLSPDGFCTAYIGSRQSERFYRVYIKESTGVYFIRFEVEFKGKDGLAGKVWRRIRENRTAVYEILKYEIGTLPDSLLLSSLRAHMAHGESWCVSQERRMTDPNKTLKWLKRQVSPAMLRLLGNHDTRDAAQMILMDWLKFAADMEDVDY